MKYFYRKYNLFWSFLLVSVVMNLMGGVVGRGQDTEVLQNNIHTDSLIIAKIEAFLKYNRFNGGLLVAKNDSIIYEKYQGYANRAKRTKMKPQTPLQIASTSKTFTAMSILKLHQQHLIDIYEPVSRYIPNFPYKAMQIVHLLCHRSGIPYYAHFLKRSISKMYSNKDVMDYIIRYKPKLQFAINSRFKYCNTNYVILASLIEKISGISYEDYLNETFWKPFEFENTFVLNSDKKLEKTTPSYTYRYRRYSTTTLDYIYGDKGIYSTPRDLYKWHKILSDTNIFSPQTLELAYKEFSKISVNYDEFKSYGLGWRLFYTKDFYKVVFHNGWWHGNKSFFMRIPDLNVVMIALDNSSSNAIYRLGNYISLMVPHWKEDPSLDFEEDSDLSKWSNINNP